MYTCDNLYLLTFQKHVTATLVALAIPSLYPPCHVFTEVGSVIISDGNDKNILGVSADGVIQCSYEYTNCPYKCTKNEEIQRIPVEIKCPYNTNNPYYDKYYGLPERYVKDK